MKLDLPLPPRASRACDFIAVGENSLDLIAVVAGFPEPDSKQRASMLMDRPGGQAATAAVGVGRLGWRARYIGVIGTDPTGQLIRSALDKEPLDARIALHDGAASRRAVIIVDRSAGTRSILECRDPKLDARPDDFDDRLFTDGRIVLLDATDSALSLRAGRLARQSSARILVDVDDSGSEARAVLQMADVAVLPARCAQALGGAADLEVALRELSLTIPARLLVATAGSAGAVALCKGASIYIDPQPAEILDTTGAGDAFRAGLAAAWLAGDDPQVEDVLGFAARVAAANCRTFGAQAGLPTSTDLGLAPPGDV